MLPRSALRPPCCNSRPGPQQLLSVNLKSFRLRRCPATCNKQSDYDERDISSLEATQIRNIVLATAVCCAFVSNVGAARAESQNWIPRRHHRHIGERFTDTWADTIVEAEHATASRVRDLERQLEQERKRADSEAVRRREAEGKLKVLTLQQKAASRSVDDDTILSIKVAGADITGPLAFLLLFGGVYFGWQRSTTAAAQQRKGRWVYDRSLGGKKIWVPYAEGQLPEQLTEAAFGELASKAAIKAAAQRKRQQPYQPPPW
eukprot:GHUV01010698.1.p1 GENE.GHUV01010698.1~~GHUV01010698.1.p1  ORF type:complete len:261 (+),score=73.57 GHUV01010698.1:134-916(+)